MNNSHSQGSGWSQHWNSQQSTGWSQINANLSVNSGQFSNNSNYNPHRNSGHNE